MPYDLTTRLVIGLSSSALFDLTEADTVYRNHGESEYRQYQQQNLDRPLNKGVAFPLIRRLLSLNKLSSPDDPLVEVILLSRNDPDTGLRVMNSIEHYQLGISRAVFLQGKSPYKYIPAFNIELFLSANIEDVQQAVAAGYPAGQILSGHILDDIADTELRIAFDFDGVLADDESELIYRNSKSISDFHAYEAEHQDVPHKPGPLKNFLQRISRIQKLELALSENDASYRPILNVSIVTARNAPSHKRVIKTMKAWDIMVNQAYFMGGVEKLKVLEVIKPHMFFDDQKLHLQASSAFLPSVHIPFGTANQKSN
ncbi:5'-nucleotidase [Catenovulum maritimum]|uniref:5'-nucleotidase n=1 Tax=Catenovulum maritimum TaxID=1513271 RepID=A0A0J8GVI3_9ALTE|nr:5'-nucleotidase [Catenovulum maritimum]KMT66795.1 5'-nucleotidase [Catenovulum maritimum]